MSVTLTGKQCQCTICGELFSSDTTFRRHRTGAYAKRGEWTGSRRCLTPAELLSKGWQKNKAGFWVTRLRDAFPTFVEAPTSDEALVPYGGRIEEAEVRDGNG